MAAPGVALQMYTVREDAARDFLGTLRAVAAMGYPAIQMAGYGGLSSAELKTRLEELGLKVAGSHVGIDRLRAALDEEIAYNHALGTPDIVVPVMPEPLRNSRDGYRLFADELNALGDRCRAAGSRLSYHNHAFELVQLDGRYALDLLLDWTDPALVYFEPDVYWLARGGVDPVQYLGKYGSRIPLVHLKDMAPDAAQSFAEVGAGTLDFKAIFDVAESGGAEWYVVEQDRCKGPALDSARLSLENLTRWGKVTR